MNNALEGSMFGTSKIGKAMVQVRAQISEDAHRSFAEIMWDMSKAFDRVPRRILVNTARALGYPMTVLRVSMLSYEWTRYLAVGPMISRGLRPRRGIAAGSAFATHEVLPLPWLSWCACT